MKFTTFFERKFHSQSALQAPLFLLRNFPLQLHLRQRFYFPSITLETALTHIFSLTLFPDQRRCAFNQTRNQREAQFSFPFLSQKIYDNLTFREFQFTICVACKLLKCRRFLFHSEMLIGVRATLKNQLLVFTRAVNLFIVDIINTCSLFMDRTTSSCNHKRSV